MQHKAAGREILNMQPKVADALTHCGITANVNEDLQMFGDSLLRIDSKIYIGQVKFVPAATSVSDVLAHFTPQHQKDIQRLISMSADVNGKLTKVLIKKLPGQIHTFHAGAKIPVEKVLAKAREQMLPYLVKLLRKGDRNLPADEAKSLANAYLDKLKVEVLAIP